MIVEKIVVYSNECSPGKVDLKRKFKKKTDDFQKFLGNSK